jgi:hypothetical protein
MILLPTITELTLFDVSDRGVPNQERIVLKVTQRIRLAEFAVSLAFKGPNGFSPIVDRFYWFSDEAWVEPGYWIYLYTGPGEVRRTQVAGTGEPAIVFHWGHSDTLLHRPEIEPMVFKLGGILTSSIDFWRTIRNLPPTPTAGTAFSSVTNDFLKLLAEIKKQ